MVRLRRVSSSSPGWARLRHGRGFRYLDADGAPLPAEDVQRCKELVIPPAWREVWICPAPNGHLQAVGTDDAGRRQYLYHPAWRERRDAEKFVHMEAFAQALIARRAKARRDLGTEPDLTTVTATAFSLLDVGIFRIGSDRYADENGSYGLTTVEKSHVTSDGAGITFEYTAKSSQELSVTVRDKRVVALLEQLRRRRGGSDRLLAYREDGSWKDLSASQVNAYVKQLLGDDFSAKDFRTWRGTVIAAHALSTADASTKTARRRSVAAAMRTVGEHLGNTPTIARASYVDPRVVDLFQDGITVAAGTRSISPGAPVSRTLEEQVLQLLDHA
ncbi:DNA topoisomerase [Aeromicrobium sp. Root495]|uniref:DNA topoisomerase IB n=1 Tax=Aeromicrobium sp. Root495 TaxID=1736550 RepID=UPI0006FDC818|nr:DNA topoisomerase IB [Aeromicrobium sp. Root495]KQY60304.1 DNA topoisomerase [Aeromicrobium sp. Root495]